MMEKGKDSERNCHIRMVFIFEKDNINNLFNYNFILFLNIIYKYFPALVRARIQSTIEFRIFSS